MKQFVNQHNCPTRLTYMRLAKYYLRKIKTLPIIKLVEFQSLVK